MFLLVVSLVLTGEYSKGQSTSDVSKFSTRPDIGIEEEETIEEDDEPEPTDEEDNDTVTSVPPKRPFGADLGLDNLTTASTEEPAKLIFASCQKDFETHTVRVNCNVPGASPGDNVVVSSTPLDNTHCKAIVGSEVSSHNVVTIEIAFGIYAVGSTMATITQCNDDLNVPDSVTFSIIVFRPEVPGIIGSLEELQDKNR